MDKTKNKSIEQGVSLSGNFEPKRRIQNLVFPTGLVINVEKREYLTKIVNALFALKHLFAWNVEEINKERPTKYGGKSVVVAGSIEISNQLISDLLEFVEVAECQGHPFGRAD